MFWLNICMAIFKAKYDQTIIAGNTTLKGRRVTLAGGEKVTRYGKRVTAILKTLKELDIPFAIEMGPKNSWYSAKLKFPERTTDK